jgi:hypothetical protein
MAHVPDRSKSLCLFSILACADHGSESVVSYLS